jgi:hypothetical protein
MLRSGLTTLLTLFSLGRFTSAGSSGTITFHVDPPTDGSPTEGCIIIAQVNNLGSPLSLTQLVPVCPSSAGTYASADPLSVDWPLTDTGVGSSSSLAIYGQVTASGGGATAGCVMSMGESNPVYSVARPLMMLTDQMQAMYLLGRSLTWTTADVLYDNTVNGTVSDPVTYKPVTWYVEAHLKKPR